MIDATRLDLLEAMGVDVYVLRTRAASGASSPSVAATGAASPRLAVVCAHGVRADARLARLFRHLPQALGISADAIDWLEADANDELAAAADAPAYLVFGAAMARSLGAQLSTMQQNTATIAVTADAARLPGDAAGKRALWQTLKPLARRLRTGSAE
ncbi:MAG: hypothetical protein QM741_03530 [Rudaea sp.]|uniref:hypothetical protein n=1 Tax=Rudaea sp. TaxID=2136325 RepID=UPI0039E2DEC4